MKRVPILRVDEHLQLRAGSTPLAYVDHGYREWSEPIQVSREKARRLAASWNALRKWPLEEIERLAENGIQQKGK
jgi:hypothetical protein